MTAPRKGHWPNGHSKRTHRADGSWRPAAKRGYLKRQNAIRAEREAEEKATDVPRADVNWQVACMNCGEMPTVATTGLCGPCCFGEADTAGGNW